MIKLRADVSSVNTVDHCPSCGGAVRLDADWCTQCFAALGQEVDPLTAPMHEVLGEPAESVMAQIAPATPSTDEYHVVIASPQPARGRHARPTAGPLDVPAETLHFPSPDSGSPRSESLSLEPTVEISDIDVMLGMLAAEHRSADPTSALAQHLGDRGAKTLFILGGVAVASMVFFVLMFIAGLIL